MGAIVSQLKLAIPYLAIVALIVGLFIANAIGVSKFEDANCEEDMPCWDCETMGNLICGPANFISIGGE